MSDKLERNKRNAMAFYDLMFNQNQPEAAIEQYVGADYIQHNPHVADGKQAFIDYFKRMTAEYPDKRVHFKRAIAEGDLVVLHCYQEWPGDEDYAGIDIFRFDAESKVVEHWDVLQIVPFLDDRGVAQGSDERGVVDADAGGSSLDIDKSREIFSADGGARCQIKVIGLDIQQQMLDIARRRAKRRGLDRSIEFRMCEPNSLGIEEPVDFVLAFWMVREVSDQKAFLVEPKALVPQHRFEKAII